jgi:hypothetical protein
MNSKFRTEGFRPIFFNWTMVKNFLFQMQLKFWITFFRLLGINKL